MEEFNLKKEEIILDSDSEIESYFSVDGYKEFFKEIYNYPVPSNEENIRLAILAQNGDKEASDKLIKHNLRLVLKVAHRHKKRINNDLFDLIQEGIFGLYKAIEKYDPDKGAFSTYAYYWVDQCIARYLSNTSRDIRVPVNIQEDIVKYNRLIDNYQKVGKTLPSDEVICDILNISLSRLNNARNVLSQTIISINTVIKDEKDAELERFIGFDDDSYEFVLQNISNEALFITLKKILTPFQYYIIYNRYLINKPKTLEELSKKIGITRERIRQLENNALNKIKPILKKENYSMHVELNNTDKYNLEPITPDSIALYMYLKDNLTLDEKEVLYYQFFGKYKLEYYKQTLSLSEQQFNNIKKSLAVKIYETKKNAKEFKKFRDNLIKSYGTKIYSIYQSSDVVIDYKSLSNEFRFKTYDEVLGMFLNSGIVLTEKDNYLLKRYFNYPNSKKYRKEKIEREIYLLSFGYKDNYYSVPKNKLLKTYMENKNEFNEQYQLFLECCYFNLKPREIYFNKYPESHLMGNKKVIIRRLERMYFNINDLAVNTFNREKYLYVKKRFSRRLQKEAILLLDLFYGVDGKEYSIQELVELLNEDYISVHGKIRNARDFCISLYNGRSIYLKNDLNKYISYINDPDINLTDETRKILKMFVIDGLEYEEISKITTLSKYKISNLITEGIRRLDFYRYNMIKIERINDEVIHDFYKFYGDIFNDLDRQIIYFTKISKMSNEEISNKMNLEKKDYVSRVIAKFNKYYQKYQTRDIKIDDEDYQNEINCHFTESVINDFSKEILSFYYGFKNKYNPKGERLGPKEITNLFGINDYKLSKIIYSSTDKIKAKKLGILSNDLSYISRDELDILLDDIHLPISDKEKEIICYLLELKGYCYKNLDELSQIYGDTKGSIRRRYQRAILNIYKYTNNEIEGKINYENDIIPNLKYFGKFDSLLIEDYFKNNLTYEELAKKYNYSFDQIVNIFERLKNNIYDLLFEKNAKKFNFDFYRKEKYNPNLPYNYDISLAIKIFDLYFGENENMRYTTPEIIQKLNLDMSLSVVNSIINELMLSFCKLENGIKAAPKFSYDEIKKYYDENNVNMPQYKKQIYIDYLESRKRKYNGVSSLIIFDLLKDRYPEHFVLSNATREQVLYYLKKYNKQMDNSVKESLMMKFRIYERDLMNGADLKHVYRILNKLRKTRNLEDEQTLKRSLINN